MMKPAVLLEVYAAATGGSVKTTLGVANGLYSAEPHGVFGRHNALSGRCVFGVAPPPRKTPPATSPVAYTPGIDVSIFVFTFMEPSGFGFNKPPAVSELGTRPAAKPADPPPIMTTSYIMDAPSQFYINLSEFMWTERRV